MTWRRTLEREPCKSRFVRIGGEERDFGSSRWRNLLSGSNL